MKKLLILTIWMAPFILQAQDKGIRFETGLSWQQVKEKAKAENKYIFMDCFATWCGPCKEMDKDVYTLEKIGDEINAHFISVKVQMDVTAKDAPGVKSWYADAKEIGKTDQVTAFPTFLFFSPDGKVVHRGAGFQNEKDFIALTKDALDPQKQYYTLLENYKQGKKDFTGMPYLAGIVKLLGDNDLALKIEGDYKTYLDGLSEEELYTKAKLEFLVSHTTSSKEKAFDIFYNHGSKADQIIEQIGMAKQVADYVIAKEEIYSYITKDNKPVNAEPDWKALEERITPKYGAAYAQPNLWNAEVWFYTMKKEWPKVVNLQMEKIEKHGLDTTLWGRVGVNDMIYDVFVQHCDDKDALNKAAGWMETILKIDVKDQASMDTYANLLYKLGRKEEGIALEEKAARIEEERTAKTKRVPDKIYRETLEKMKRNELLFPVQD